MIRTNELTIFYCFTGTYFSVFPSVYGLVWLLDTQLNITQAVHIGKVFKQALIFVFKSNQM